MLTLQIDGIPELAAKLATLSRFAPQAAGDALEKNAQPMLAAAKARAAVRSGAMRDGIHLEDPEVTANNASIVIQTGTRADMNIPADDPFYYPAAHEYGTSHQQARPFMRPAFDDTAQQVADATGRDIGQAIEQRGAE